MDISRVMCVVVGRMDGFNIYGMLHRSLSLVGHKL